MPSRTRLKDVAALAGVSVKTVSNVVNGYEHVTASTRTGVETALATPATCPTSPPGACATVAPGMALALPELHAPYFAESPTTSSGPRPIGADRAGRRDRGPAGPGTAGRGRHPGPPHRRAHPQPARADRGRPRRPGRRRPLVLLGGAGPAHVADRVAVDNVRAAREATVHLLAGAGAGSPRSGCSGPRPA